VLTKAHTRLKYAFRAAEIAKVIFAHPGSRLPHVRPANTDNNFEKETTDRIVEKVRGICDLSSQNTSRLQADGS
jgi:hypothetical protein